MVCLDGIELLSIDIFDTLIFRMVDSPASIFNSMGVVLKEKYEKNFKYTPYEFKQLRLVAEQKAKEIKKQNSGSGEVTLREIYDVMPVTCISKQELMELEIQTEKKYSFINPKINSIIEKCNYKKIPVVLVSDMYFSKEQIKDILKCNDFDLRNIDEILVSSEFNKSKSEGSLFDVLKERYNYIRSDKILHIGDNYISDIVNAQIHGMKTLYYNVISDDNETLFELEKIKYGSLVSEISAIRKLAHSNSENYNDKEKVWYEFGAAVFGPFLTLFCEWIIDIAEKENIKSIYPLMREGYILEKILKKSLKQRGLSIENKPMYVSRKALFLSSIEKFDDEVLNRIFEKNSYTVENLFESLKIYDYIGKFEEYKSILLNKAYKIEVDNINLKQQLFNYLLSENIIKVIQNNIVNEKQLVIKYLEDNFNTNETFITVDLGFRGTMQTAIDRILKKNQLHILAFGEESIKYNLLNGQDIRGFVGNAGENLEIIKSITWCPDMLEELMMGNLGSTIGYMERYSKVEPILDENRIPFEEIKLKEVCFDGILDFQDMFLNIVKNKSFIKEESLLKRKEFGLIMQRFHKLPTYLEAKTFSKIHHEYNNGSRSLDKIVKENELEDLNCKEIENYLRTSNPTDNKWPEAVVTLKDDKCLIRKCIENSNMEGYFKTMCNIAQKLKNDEISKAMIYGAGEAGLYLERALNFYNIKVIYFIDRKKELHGKFLNDIEIKSLKQAIKEGNNIFAIGSFAFRDEIKNDILEYYSNSDILPKIYSL